MKALRSALLAVIAVSCFDPLYELEPGTSWTVCCRSGKVDTCSCADELHCAFQLTACPANTCVEVGSCNGGTGGGVGGSGGSGGAAGSGTGGGFVTSDAGTSEDAGMGNGDGGLVVDGGGVADAGPPDAGLPITGYEPCCVQNHVASCACFGACSGASFTACSRGRCVATGVSCPP